MKANIRTKANDDDLHIARRMLALIGEGVSRGQTVECERDELQGHVPQPNVQPGRHSTWPNTRKVEHLGH